MLRFTQHDKIFFRALSEPYWGQGGFSALADGKYPPFPFIPSFIEVRTAHGL
jgi:hypothetical protein